MAVRKAYAATVTMADDGRLFVPVPFDPDGVWGPKARHLVTGTVAGRRIRGELQRTRDTHRLIPGAAWLRDCGIAAGDRVDIEIEAEGLQRADLADDVATALMLDPGAGAAFDSLAQFYRKAFLGWIDATKRRPEERPIRIAEMVELLRAGKKQRSP